MGFEKNYQAINLSKQINIHRTYSTQVVSSREYHINPKFITGFVDGCFTIFIRKNLKLDVGWMVEARLSISLHQKDQEILELIKSLWGVGNI